MSFKQLYDSVSKVPKEPIIIDRDIVPLVKALTGQDEVYFVAVELDTKISLGHIKQYRDSLQGVYAESKWITEIRYHHELNMCWQRFVCCKELMHAFDTEAERTNTRAKYLKLMGEVESPPLPADRSPMMDSENETKWKALAVLCPLPLRDKFYPDWKAKKISDLEVALRLRIPEVAIKTVMDDYFDHVVGHFTA